MHKRLTRLLLALNGIAIALVLLQNRPAIQNRSALDAADQAAGLDRRVPALDLNDFPLDQALRILAASSGTRIVMSPRLSSLPQHLHPWSNRGISNPTGWKTPIRLHVHGVSVAAVLDLILDQLDHAFRVQAGYAARDDGSIFFGGEEEMPRFAAIYDVSHIIHIISAGTDLSQKPNEDFASPQYQIEHLLSVHAIGDTWSDTDPVVRCVGDRLFVITTARWHRYIRQVLAELQSIHGPWPPGGSVRFRNPFFVR